MRVSAMERRERSIRWAAVLVIAVVVAAAGLLAGCGVHPPEGTIVVHDLQFDPPAVTVAKGQTITWTNQDQIAVLVRSASFGASPTVPGQFSSDPLNPGDSYTHTFDTAGTFTYGDPFHPYITGAVTVK
jgi:plastocyanin